MESCAQRAVGAGELQHFLWHKPLAKPPLPHAGPVTECFEMWPLPGVVLGAIPGDRWVRRGLMGCGEGLWVAVHCQVLPTDLCSGAWWLLLSDLE